MLSIVEYKTYTHKPRNNTMLKQIIAASALALTPAALGQASGGAQAGAEILAPLTVTLLEDLYFGTIVPDTTGEGTVRLSGTTAPNKACAGVTCLSADETLAKFETRGSLFSVLRASRPANTVITNDAGDTMEVTDFTDGNGPNWNGVIPLGNDGKAEISIGATLTVPANQPEGDYVGTFVLTVEYN